MARWGAAWRRTEALVGDGPEKRLNPDTELAMALLDEATGEPVLKVLDPGQTKRALRSGKVKPKRADSGGMYGGGNTAPTMTFNQYAPADLGSQPFIRKLFGGNAGPSFRGIGAQLGNPDIGMSVRRCC